MKYILFGVLFFIGYMSGYLTAALMTVARGNISEGEDDNS